ncbi:MAG: amidohydrolase family protein [Verrucomicrobiae bacterium]|nr:amidohydrolase family protein [Verrucomicrobiae bacterium]
MILDAHCHLGCSPQFRCPDASVETILKVMDRLGIERAVCAHQAMLYGEWELGFRESVEAHEKSGGRLLLYTVFDPTQPQSLSLVERCLDTRGFVGIKIHPSIHGCFADDDRYEIVWQLAARRNVPILTHSWDISEQNPAQKFSFPDRFERYAASYPDVALILGHAGGRYRGHIAAASLAKRHANVFVDLSGDCYCLGLVEYLVAQIGSEKVLFGSDLTWIDPRTQLGMVLDADIPAGAKENILYLNAKRVFSGSL